MNPKELFLHFLVMSMEVGKSFSASIANAKWLFQDNKDVFTRLQRLEESLVDQKPSKEVLDLHSDLFPPLFAEAVTQQESGTKPNTEVLLKVLEWEFYL